MCDFIQTKQMIHLEETSSSSLIREKDRERKRDGKTEGEGGMCSIKKLFLINISLWFWGVLFYEKYEIQREHISIM